MALRGALVGFGQVAEKAHLPGFKEHGIELVAVAEANAQRREAAKAALPGARLYETYEALLETENGLDFVDIATPPFLHYKQASAALARGLSCLCEKPLALAPEEAEALKRAASAAGKVVFTVHNWAYSPQWLKILSLVESGAVGELRHVELHALRTKPAGGALPGDWRKQADQAGGGILIDHGWHNLYLLHRLLKAKPGRVMARLQPASGAVEEEATVFLEFPSASGMIYLTWRSGVRRNTALVVGSRAVLELLDDEMVLRTETGAERFSFDAPLSAGSSHPAWFSAMLPDFMAELADPAKRGRNFEEAAFCLGIIHRAYQAVRQGRSPLRAALTPQERSRR